MLRRWRAGISPSLSIRRAAAANPMSTHSRRPSACLSNPSSSPVSHAASDGTGDGAVAALVVVREIEVAGIRGIAGFRFGPTRRIAASCYKVCRDGFDSFGTAGIAELSGKMGRMASIVGNPYVWYVGTRDEIADAFSYLIHNLDTALV